MEITAQQLKSISYKYKIMWSENKITKRNSENYIRIKNVMMYILVFFIYTQNSSVKSQEIWDLKKCVDYATENNIDLEIKREQVIIQEINLFESKAKRFPDLNLGSAVNVNYGRNIDGNTNEITYNQTISNNFVLSSSLDIFQGFVKQNKVRFNKYLLSAEKEECELIKNKLIFDVITAYYICLYSVGLENVAKTQADLSEMQYYRMQKLAEVGKESPITVQDLKSQWVGDQLNLTKAQNQKNKKFLELKQLLRPDPETDFFIDTVSNVPFVITELPVIDSIYNNAIRFLPEIKQQEFLLDASEKDLLVSKGMISPHLYLSAGMGSNYFDGDDLTYPNQIQNNQNQQIRLGLVIPIFNGASTYSNIQRKKIVLNNQKLQIEKNKEQVYSEIVNITDNIKSAEKEYYTSLELYKYSKLSFQSTSKKLEKGLASTSDFETEKQRLALAEAEMLKAKLSYIMYIQILEFYRTGNWNHLNLINN
jgi:outer membrane protein